MSRLRTLLCAGIVLGCFASRARGQPVVGFDLKLLRPGFPTFDVNSVIQGREGDVVELAAEASITSFGMADRGVQGWSLSLMNTGVDVVSISDEGAVIREKSEGGLLDVGFLKYEIVNPNWNGGQQGLVQACVLSTFRQVILPPDTRQLVGTSRYRARVPGAPALASIRYEDGLRGSGQPLQNIATIQGASQHPRLRSRSIAIGGGQPLPEERCGDGADNDQNQKTDCDDPYCRGDVACGAEDCADGIDNDGDGRADCQDSKCRSFTVACDEPELCEDGADNDRDGDTDCADSECYYLGDCPGPEICGENIDNDLDGKTDCEDIECVGILPCAGFELCDNGIDDTGDGKIDCDDEFCIRFASSQCEVVELCGDGLDNDLDGRIDCEDERCAGIAPCPPLEVCGDGIDNDQDGMADCRDPQCERFPSCIGPEVCDDGKDNDFDRLIDCDDPGCAGVGPCPEPEVCGDGLDNDEDGKADCADPQCFGIRPCPGPEVCDDRFDNDADGRTDCADPDCAQLPACRGAERCDDGVDNDDDLRTDCDDFDCRAQPVCAGREVCGDGADNNADGRADCEDPDCEMADPCAGGGGGYDMVVIADDAALEGGEYVTHADPEITTGIPVTVYIVGRGGDLGSGVQGWSLSIAHDKDLIGFDPAGGAPTTAGTDVEEFFSGGFTKTEPARDTGAGGRGWGGSDDGDGFVSAIVLSFTEPRALPPSGAHSVARARYVLKEGFAASGVEAAGVRFQDGLRGSGQPVTNALTVDGRTVKPARLVPLAIRRADLSAPFVRGDTNVDRKVNIADAVWIVNELLRRGPRSVCPRAGDANADGLYDLSDAMFLVQWMFLSGRIIPRPYPTCGTAPGPKELDCPENAVGYCG
ncbi:MAG: hypothetical protein HY721_21595 [Planctomycetes bacterium]|nr:hypothetical protein [Planctomycetota bacterium]